jgi:integrase
VDLAEPRRAGVTAEGEPVDIRPPSVEQVRRLLAVVFDDSLDFFTYLHLAVMTGARRSQLLATRWSDVDFDHAALAFLPGADRDAANLLATILTRP